MRKPLTPGQGSFVVRVAVSADTARVDALLRRAYPRLLKADYPPSVMVLAIPLISRAQPGLVACGTYFVVEDEDAGIIGAGGWTRARPGGGAEKSDARTGNVRHVVTDDRQVRRGVGRSLMTHIFQSAQIAGIGWLDCMSTRTAVPFYTAMGFKDLGPIVISLGPGIAFPAVAMRRSLGP
jgi:GNAT superfamily N-acetyltransferase